MREQTEKPKKRTQGMNWIRQEKRLAIYLRDGLSCAYCGASVESGAQLSLDHVRPYSKGGNNHESNLVTCCTRCNSARGNRTVASFARGVAEYLNVEVAEITNHIRRIRRRSLTSYMTEARELVARRGSVARVLRGE